GAGIGGLTPALAIARTGGEGVVFDQAERPGEIGAGIPLLPNASRGLIPLGPGDALRRPVVAPAEVPIMNAANARRLGRAPLGTALAQRYGAPYWITHRADFQAVLLDAVRADARITLRLGARVDDFASHPGGVTITTTSGQQASHQRGRALIAADGLWSTLRRRLGHRDEPSFAGHTAWRALAPTAGLPPAIAAAAVNLWFGRDAHLVHYPIRRGDLVKVVAIVRDDWHDGGWGAPAAREDVLARFPPANWPPAARTVLAAPPTWQKWALYDRLPTAHWGDGPVTLLG